MTVRYLLFAVRCDLALTLTGFSYFPGKTETLANLLMEGLKIDAIPPKGWYKNVFTARQQQIQPSDEDETLNN